MAILEKEVLVSINQRNMTYYKNKKYDVILHEETLVKVEDLSPSSRVKLTKICDNPDCDVKGGRYVYGQTYQNILNYRNNNEFGYDLCQSCGKVFFWKKRKSNIKYEKHWNILLKPTTKNICCWNLVIKISKSQTTFRFQL